MTYRPQQANPEDKENLLRYLFRELTRIAATFDTVSNPIPTLHVEPAKLIEGTKVIADGTDWDPGNGNGLYIYMNAAWVFIV